MYAHGVTINEEDYLQLSGLQHFVFCRRQWALIHLESQWKENLRTVEGQLLHTHAHDTTLRERRGNTLILRSVSVVSHTLGISGQCDVVEFHADSNGVPIHGETGLWLADPVEYKHGSPKEHNADEMQLCAQAMCLEEMLCCTIPEGALYYGQTRHRVRVPFTDPLRDAVKSCLTEMHQLYHRGYTPKVKPTKSCNACSLKELCLPALMRGKSASHYLKSAWKEDL